MKISNGQTRPPVVGDVTTIVIGAGQAGLAASRCLDERGIEHLILERGEIANSWRKERWQSLKLLTPNWQTVLPGHGYQGDDPDGFMGITELVSFFDDYARRISAPIITGTTVDSVSPMDDGYRVNTNRGVWHCRTVVMASGAFNIPVLPRFASALPTGIESLTPHDYRSPDEMAEGGVLVVGASATGLQLAREIQKSGRPVTLCVGEHVRLPRRYRGRDILHWMHCLGLLDESYREVDDISRARRVPSAQLVGSASHGDLDLNSLTRAGVNLVGRMAGLHNNKVQFSGALSNVCKMGDLKMNRLLRSIDDWIAEIGEDQLSMPAEEFSATNSGSKQTLSMSLASGEIKSVVWACGFRPDYSWLKVPVLNRKNQLVHDGGVTASPGLYAMGLPFMRRRKSSFIFGAGDDARDICDHLAAYVADSVTARSIAVA
jgi:putative flavoprotein involved in K+ transport